MNFKIIIDPIAPMSFEVGGTKPTLQELQTIVRDDIEQVPSFGRLEHSLIAEMKTMFDVAEQEVKSGRRDVAACAQAWRDLHTVYTNDRLASKTCVAYCGEHGKMNNLDPNFDATWLWARTLGIRFDQMPDHLVGPVVILCGDANWVD